MATVIPYAQGNASDGLRLQRSVANLAQAYFDSKHHLDHMVALKGGVGGTDWAAIEAAYGAPAEQGEVLFNAVNTWLANMTNAYNAAASLDQIRPA